MIHLLNRIAPGIKQLFLIDGLGALLSAFFLGVVLVRYHAYFGMPVPVLQVLAGIALVFALYSLSCHVLLKADGRPFLRAIALANLLYCALTAVLLVYHAGQLTPLGWTYFILELLIVCSLVRVELHVASRKGEVKPSTQGSRQSKTN